MKVSDGCPIKLDALGNEVHLQLGDHAAPDVELVIDTDVFRELVHLGTEALRELDVESDMDEADAMPGATTAAPGIGPR